MRAAQLVPAAPQSDAVPVFLVGRIRAVHEGGICRLIPFRAVADSRGSCPRTLGHYGSHRGVLHIANLIVPDADQSQHIRHVFMRAARRKVAIPSGWPATQERIKLHAARWRSLARGQWAPSTEYRPPTHVIETKDLIRHRSHP